MKISVIIIVKNESQYIQNCIDALLKQSYQDFEIIVVDSGSTDGTGEIVKSFGNKKIRYFYEPFVSGVAESRNKGIKKSLGEYVFFTDGDCVPGKHWLEEGLRVLETKLFAGVEGKTYYETQDRITISDFNTLQFIAGKYMTCNTAYPRNILEKVNYFDTAFKYGHEDRDLAFRVMKSGKIFFCEDMLVAHQKKRIHIKALFKRSRRAENLVYFINKHGRRSVCHSVENLYFNILYPKKLLLILFPPIIIITNSYNSFYDLLFGFFYYLALIYERVLIWKAAIKNRIFIL